MKKAPENPLRRLIKMTKKKSVGLVLSSGGVLGMAHVGAILALTEAKIPIHYISGTSIGAWVGVYYALFQNIERLKEATLGYRKEKRATFRELTLKGGLIRGDKMEELMNELLDGKSFKDIRIPVAITAVDQFSGKKVVLKKGNLARALRASMSIPGLFSPVEYEGMSLVDGGVLDPIPVEEVKNLGADFVIAINIEVPPDDQSSSPLATIMRSFYIMQKKITESARQQADIVITPKFDTNGAARSWREYFTQNDKAQEFMDAGYRATKMRIAEIEKRLS